MRILNLDLKDVQFKDDGLWTVGQFFNQQDFDYVQASILSVEDRLYMPSPASDLRDELTWFKDGILEELTNAFSQPNVEKFFNELAGIRLRFNQARVWRDKPGYRIPFHEDDESSYLHFQIYIHSGQEDIGTTWYTTMGRHSCPFIPNTGYITVCDKRLPHGMLKYVEDVDRISIYTTFKKL